VIETRKSTNFFRLGLRRLLFLVCLGLGGVFASATLVRFAPGYGAEERELDPRWRADSVEALRQKQGLHRGLPSFYFHYLSALAHGDLGESDSLKRPVGELLRIGFEDSALRGWQPQRWRRWDLLHAAGGSKLRLPRSIVCCCLYHRL